MTAVESFRFLACTISQDTEWDIPIDYCQKGPALAVLPSPAEEVQPATGAAETVLLCHHWIRPLHINNCLIQHSYQIWHQKTTEGSSGLLSESLVQPSPLSKNCTYPEWAKELAKSLWTPHIQHPPVWTAASLADATELWALVRPDTGTVSYLRQSISWTLEYLTINMKSTTLSFIYLFNTYLLHFKFAPNIPVHT